MSLILDPSGDLADSVGSVEDLLLSCDPRLTRRSPSPTPACTLPTSRWS